MAVYTNRELSNIPTCEVPISEKLSISFLQSITSSTISAGAVFIVKLLGFSLLGGFFFCSILPVLFLSY